ncbi:MAG TPA: phosphatase PAP2 family protein [Blastocatellia bacterium]|nr:phosphatase PAP2 family protein [Blastocatellia bacterium]
MRLKGQFGEGGEIVNFEEEANILLGALSLFLTIVGASAWWIAAHAAQTRAFVDRLRNLPLPRRAASRYRSQIQFLVRRFRPGGAFGLSFTIGVAILTASAWVFGGLLEDVFAHEEIALVDAPVMSYIAARRLPWLTNAMEATTYLGGAGFVVAALLLGGVALRRRTRSWRPFLLLGAAALGAATLDLAVKLAVHRPRPPAAWMAAPVAGWAFPSGHSVESTAVYGALAYLIAETQKDWRMKVGSLASAILISFLIGISRVYLGVHWLTDVVAGWALGFAWLAIVFTTDSIIQGADRNREGGARVR